MAKMSFGKIVKSFIITGFTLTAALIWRDAIIELISVLTPAQNWLAYKFLFTAIATIILLAGIYFILKTEEETEHILYKSSHEGKKKNERKRKI